MVNESIVLLTFIHSIELFIYIFFLSFPKSGLKHQIFTTTFTFIATTVYLILCLKYKINLNSIFVLISRKLVEFAVIITTFLFLIGHMIKNIIDRKPLISPKLFSSLTREDDFYSVLIKFSEELTFFYSSEEDKERSRTLNQDNLKETYTSAIEKKNREKYKKKIINGYDVEFTHDLSECYPITVSSISFISYPIELTLFLIIINTVKNLLKLILAMIYRNIKNIKNDKEKNISETDAILYQQVLSNIPFGSDSEDSDYEEINDKSIESDEDEINEEESSNDEDNFNESNDIYKELFEINCDHINFEYLKNSNILTRNQSETLKYVNDIQMPIYNNDNTFIKRNLIKDKDKNNSVITNTFKNKSSNGYDNKLHNITDINEIKNQYLSTDLCVSCRKRRRSVVLWPCGCFCLCDICRKVLALEKYNKCPCTNNEVQGYSKIFIP
jgi:hypothetical protein